MILEPQQNLAWTSQIIGRIIRVGQFHEQHIYYVCCDLSVEEKVYSRNIEKYMPIMLGGLDPNHPQYQTELMEIFTNLDTTLDEYWADPEIRRNANAHLARRRISDEFGIPFDCLNPVTNAFADIGINNGDARILTERERAQNLSDFNSGSKAEYYMREYSFNILQQSGNSSEDDIPQTPSGGALYQLHPRTPTSLVKKTTWRPRNPTTPIGEAVFEPPTYKPRQPSGKGQTARLNNYYKRSSAKTSRYIHTMLHKEKDHRIEPDQDACNACLRDTEQPE